MATEQDWQIKTSSRRSVNFDKSMDRKRLSVDKAKAIKAKALSSHAPTLNGSSSDEQPPVKKQVFPASAGKHKKLPNTGIPTAQKKSSHRPKPPDASITPASDSFEMLTYAEKLQNNMESDSTTDITSTSSNSSAATTLDATSSSPSPVAAEPPTPASPVIPTVPATIPPTEHLPAPDPPPPPQPPASPASNVLLTAAVLSTVPSANAAADALPYDVPNKPSYSSIANKNTPPNTSSDKQFLGQNTCSANLNGLTLDLDKFAKDLELQHPHAWSQFRGFQISGGKKIIELTFFAAGAKDSLLQRGLNTHGAHLAFKPDIARAITVSLFQIPIDFPEKEVDVIMQRYGAIQNRYMTRKRINGKVLLTGTRVYFLTTMTSPVPKRLRIGGRQCHTVYTGQDNQLELIRTQRKQQQEAAREVERLAQLARERAQRRQYDLTGKAVHSWLQLEGDMRMEVDVVGGDGQTDGGVSNAVGGGGPAVGGPGDAGDGAGVHGDGTASPGSGDGVAEGGQPTGHTVDSGVPSLSDSGGIWSTTGFGSSEDNPAPLQLTDDQHISLSVLEKVRDAIGSPDFAVVDKLVKPVFTTPGVKRSRTTPDDDNSQDVLHRLRPTCISFDVLMALCSEKHHHCLPRRMLGGECTIADLYALHLHFQFGSAKQYVHNPEDCESDRYFPGSFDKWIYMDRFSQEEIEDYMGMWENLFIDFSITLPLYTPIS